MPAEAIKPSAYRSKRKRGAADFKARRNLADEARGSIFWSTALRQVSFAEVRSQSRSF